MASSILACPMQLIREALQFVFCLFARGNVFDDDNEIAVIGGILPYQRYRHICPDDCAVLVDIAFFHE